MSAAPRRIPSQPQPQEEQGGTRRVALQLYIEERQHQPDEQDALKALLARLSTNRNLLPPNSPPADPTLIYRLCSEDRWEERFKQHSPLQGEIERLKLALYAARDRREFAESIFEEASANDTSTKIKQIREAHALLVDTQDAESSAEQQYRKLLMERDNLVESQQRTEVLFQDLLTQYEGLGPQYEILCRQVATISAKLERLTHSGRDVEIKEFTQLQQAHVASINQLQRFTESTKSESVSKEAKEMVEAAVTMLGQIIGPEAPNLWNKALTHLRSKLVAS